MIYRYAKNLYNGDEVIEKASGRSIRVLSIEVIPHIEPYSNQYGDGFANQVSIEGHREDGHYDHWSHTAVR